MDIEVYIQRLFLLILFLFAVGVTRDTPPSQDLGAISPASPGKDQVMIGGSGPNRLESVSSLSKGGAKPSPGSISESAISSGIPL